MTWTNAKNRRRCELIDRATDGTLTSCEQYELARLQGEMLAYRRSVAPLPIAETRELLAELSEKARKEHVEHGGELLDLGGVEQEKRERRGGLSQD